MNAFAVAFLLIAGTIPDAMEKLEDSFARLKEAQSGSDAARVQSLAGTIWTLSHEVTSEPQPEGEAAIDAWKKRMAWVRDVELHTEYAVSATALRASDPAETVALLSALQKQNPKSKYMDEAYGAYFVALQKTGAAAKIPVVAEEALKNFPNNEDCLLVLADRALSRNQTDQALNYSERLIAAMGKHPRPEGMPPADWERKRAVTLGRAHWIAGVMHSQKTSYYEADKDLRIALPLVKDSESMRATALFHLGVANYQMGAQIRDRPRILEAAHFSEECSKIKGPLAMQAWRNAQIMRAEAQKVR
jgi:tetratricopeptide (TPR) repeat protein